MNKRQLSLRSGVGRPTIDAWLGGTLPLHEQPVAAIAEALSCHFADLWGEARELGPDERLAYTQLRIFAKRVLELIQELEIDAIPLTPTPEETGETELRVAEPRPPEYGRLARTDAPPAKGDRPKPAAKKRRDR